MSATASSRCPDDDTLGAFASGMLPRSEADVVDLHLGLCSACFEVVATLRVAIADSVVDSPASSRKGEFKELSGVGRYVVEELVGSGASGWVAIAETEADDATKAQALVRLVPLMGTVLLRSREAQRLADLADATLLRIHEHVRLRARLKLARGSALLEDYRFHEAMSPLIEAASAFENGSGETEDILLGHIALAAAHRSMGDRERSSNHMLRAERLFDDVYARKARLPRHLYALVKTERALEVAEHGDLDRALASLDGAKDKLEASGTRRGAYQDRLDGDFALVRILATE